MTAPNDLSPHSAEHARQADARPPRATGPAPTILLFEPSWVRRQIAAFTIRRAGALVLCAGDLSQTQKQLSCARADIAIITNGPSGRNGDEVLADIRMRAPWIYCVSASGGMDDERLEDIFSRGYDDFLLWPLSTRRLRVLVDAAQESLQIATAVNIHTPPASDYYSPELHAQLLEHLKEETDGLFALLVPERFQRSTLRRGMHRMRSGLLLVGYRALADECLDLERDCERGHADDGMLARRGWRIARQVRALSA